MKEIEVDFKINDNSCFGKQKMQGSQGTLSLYVHKYMIRVKITYVLQQKGMLGKFLFMSTIF